MQLQENLSVALPARTIQAFQGCQSGLKIGAVVDPRNSTGGSTSIGVDLPKILRGNRNIGGQKVVITAESMDVSQALGDTRPGCPPKVYTYGIII